LFLRKCCRLDQLAIHSHLFFPVDVISTSLNKISAINNSIISSSDSWYSLGAGRPTNRSIPGEGKVFSLLQNVQTISGANPGSYSMSTGAVSGGGGKLSGREANHLHLALKIRMGGANLLLPVYYWQYWSLKTVEFPYMPFLPSTSFSSVCVCVCVFIYTWCSSQTPPVSVRHRK